MKQDKSIKTVERYYNENVDKEWDRLSLHSFEFIITTTIMNRFIKPGDTILDIGGGPGRYSIFFASLGCKVTLVDLSSSNMEIAKKEAKRAGVEIDTHICNALDLSSLDLGLYDHVFLMGPLYHLLSRPLQKQAITQALSHLKPEGHFYASFIMLFAGMIYYMKYDAEGVITDNMREKYINCIIDDKSYSGDAFTRAYFHTPKKILSLMKPFPIEKIMLFGQEGILGPSELKIIEASPDAKQEWLRIAIELADRKEYLSLSEHAMYIGKKKA